MVFVLVKARSFQHVYKHGFRAVERGDAEWIAGPDGLILIYQLFTSVMTVDASQI